MKEERHEPVRHLEEGVPNNSMQRTVLRAAAEAERYPPCRPQ